MLSPYYILLYGFGSYLLVTLVFLVISVSLHELGHILFARLNHLDYRVLFKGGNITIAADWDRIKDKKVYGHMLGIVFGLPPVVAGGWAYSTPLFMLLYLLACYDDFGAVARELLDCKKVFGLG